mmetsp:Transcript_21794/g.62497  ORF Transcript_21794/g.62497 Transcript_21794/m.62497 type:complete len:323 (+) Transcript_21794:162-1130(+)
MKVHQGNVESFDVILNAAPELRLSMMTKGKDGTDGVLVGRGRVVVVPVPFHHLSNPFAILIHPSSVVGVDVVRLLAHEIGPNEEHASVVECKILLSRRLPLNSRGQRRCSVPVHFHRTEAVHPIAPAFRWIGTIIPIVVTRKHKAGDGTVLLVHVLNQLVAPLAAVGLTTSLHNVTHVDSELSALVIEVGHSLDGHVLDLVLHNELLGLGVRHIANNVEREGLMTTKGDRGRTGPGRWWSCNRSRPGNWPGNRLGLEADISDRHYWRGGRRVGLKLGDDDGISYQRTFSLLLILAHLILGDDIQDGAVLSGHITRIDAGSRR